MMDSCFPPLATLSLRDNNRKSSSSNGHRPTSTEQVAPLPAETGKIEILQDLDLYYIRQIAHNLKVRAAHA
ncbi:hypothetical protein C0J52_18880 [Blattella germanica]|nr:hypothetical protein C0J52_18880 [Blattella germanica]